MQEKKVKRGYTGIGIYNPKTADNMGTLWRSAYLYGVDFIFTIGERYKKQPTDTLKAVRRIPLFNFKTWEDFKESIPKESELVLVEQGGKPLQTIKHPTNAVYVLGAEDNGIPEEYLRGNRVVEIESSGISSLNVATAGTIILYDRFVKSLTPTTKQYITSY